MLSISTTRGQIGITTTNARYEMQQPKGEQTIRTTNPKVKINGSFPTIEIDQDQTKYEYGYRTNMEILEEAARLGRQQAYQAIARIAQDGDRMKDIRNRIPAAIPELALKNSQPNPVSINLGIIGVSRPKTEVVGGYEMDFEPGTVEIEYSPRKVETQYAPGKVEVYMQQHPSIEISHQIDTKA